MQLVAVPVFGLAMVTLLMAAINFLVFLRRRSLQLHLYLALSCLGIAIYDVTCVGLYQATDLAMGAVWQRAQIVTLALVGPVVIRFVVLHTGYDWPRVTRFVTVTAVVMALIGAVERHGLLLSSVPAVKRLDLPIFGPVTYHEMEAGPMFLMFLVIVAMELVFFFWAGVVLWRQGNRHRAVPFIVAIGLFFSSIFSDALVTSGIHTAPYLTEYGFTAMIILTGLLLTDEFLRTAALEKALQQSSRLESLGRLAGGVAHDLNNYLTPVLGFSDLVMEELEPDSQAHADLQRVQVGTMKAAALTQQLLAFGRRQVLDQTVTTVDRIVRELEPLLSRLLGERIEIELALHADHAAVRVDVGQIEQLILNLAANARDAMPDGGRLRLASAELPEEVVLEIVDEGCGMAGEALERAFDPFFTTKAPGEGTGLGLAQVHGIVEQHGGNVNVSSEVNAGTTIRIGLPRCTQAPLAELSVGVHDASDRSFETPSRRRERILVVDDEENVRQVMCRALETCGYRIAGAAGLADARAQLQGGEPFDLLISDLLLVDGNGLDVVAEVRKTNPYVAVLLISGFPENLLEECRGAADEFELLRKPIAIAELRERVRVVLAESASAATPLPEPV